MGMGLLLHRCGDDDRHGDSVSFSELFLGAEAGSGHSFLCSPECGHVSDENRTDGAKPGGRCVRKQTAEKSRCCFGLFAA